MKKEELFIDTRKIYKSKPEYNYLYNKMLLANQQRIDAMPMEIPPSATNYPIIVKPALVLFDTYSTPVILNNEDEYSDYLDDNDYLSEFWMPYMKGTEHNVDILIKKGEVRYFDAFKKMPTSEGYYYIHDNNYLVPSEVCQFLSHTIGTYIGPVHIKVIGNVVLDIIFKWWDLNHIWIKNREILSNIPLIVYNNKQLARIIDDMCYIPCFVRSADMSEEEMEHHYERFNALRAMYRVMCSSNEPSYNYEQTCLGYIATSAINMNTINDLKNKYDWV